jgi:hypothetical protein
MKKVAKTIRYDKPMGIVVLTSIDKKCYQVALDKEQTDLVFSLLTTMFKGSIKVIDKEIESLILTNF